MGKKHTGVIFIVKYVALIETWKHRNVPMVTRSELDQPQQSSETSL